MGRPWTLESRQKLSKTKTRHGLSRSATYNSWRAMLRRCTSPKDTYWHLYGGRGIAVCAAWIYFENFLADMGERPEGTTLDRRDVNGNYEPDNCRWASSVEQRANQRPLSAEAASQKSSRISAKKIGKPGPVWTDERKQRQAEHMRARWRNGGMTQAVIKMIATKKEEKIWPPLEQ